MTRRTPLSRERIIAAAAAVADRAGVAAVSMRSVAKVLGVPENANATFTIRTYQGSFSTDLPLEGVSRADIQRGRRVTTTLGNGSADVSLESFGGSIRVRRGSAARTRGRE